MSVSVRIKQKSLFKKKLNINEIIEWTGLSYGVCDESYRLRDGETAEHTLLYNKNRLARGIDVSIDGADIVLLLSLPTSPAEIREFYGVIDRICNKLKVKTYIREEEQVSLNDKDKFIEYDERGSIAGLEDIREKIETDEYRRLEINKNVILVYLLAAVFCWGYVWDIVDLDTRDICSIKNGEGYPEWHLNHPVGWAIYGIWTGMFKWLITMCMLMAYFKQRM